MNEVRRTGRLGLEPTQQFTTGVWGYNVGRFYDLTTSPLYNTPSSLHSSRIAIGLSDLVEPALFIMEVGGGWGPRLPSPSDVRYSRLNEDYARLGRLQE